MKRFPACLFYKDDKIFVKNTETDELYPTLSYKRSTKSLWHVTFFTRWGDKYWGKMGEDGVFTAIKYLNYRPVAGGSGHHNVAYRRHKAGLR